jgi:serine/threonine-protein kinase haspin
VVKIGEGTYGEAFKAAGVVLKIVPMEGPQFINDAPQKLAADLQAEALIALTLTRLKDARDVSGMVLGQRVGDR